LTLHVIFVIMMGLEHLLRRVVCAERVHFGGVKLGKIERFSGEPKRGKDSDMEV
jgi:hypothetical protein